MATSDPGRHTSIIRFGVFEVDLRSGELRKNGLRIRLQEQPFQVLVTLLSRPGEIVSREELRDRIWPEGTFVCFDYALNTAIKKVRVALSDDACVPRYIETIPRRGYRFIGDVRPVADLHVESAPGSVLSSPKTDRETGFRYQWLIAVLVCWALLGGVAAYFARHAASPSPPGVGRVMVVVLPFENLSREPSQDPLCLALTEEVIAQLGRIDPQGIGVASRSTVIAYQESHRSVAAIGRALRADYLLEGSVRRNERRIRVSAQLIRSTDHSNVWANEFDGELDDSLAFQSAVAGAISQEVRAALLASAPAHSR
jgi:TolB-like protein/DNA-binding winged helix-turn-helix (wHTH) protein